MHLSREVSFVGCASPHPSIHIESMLGKDPVALAADTQCPWALFPAGKADDGGDADMYDSEGALIKALEEKFPGENVSKRFPNVPHGFVTRGNIKEHAAASGAEVAKAEAAQRAFEAEEFRIIGAGTSMEGWRDTAVSETAQAHAFIRSLAEEPAFASEISLEEVRWAYLVLHAYGQWAEEDGLESPGLELPPQVLFLWPLFLARPTPEAEGGVRLQYDSADYAPSCKLQSR